MQVKPAIVFGPVDICGASAIGITMSGVYIPRRENPVELLGLVRIGNQVEGALDSLCGRVDGRDKC